MDGRDLFEAKSEGAGVPSLNSRSRRNGMARPNEPRATGVDRESLNPAVRELTRREEQPCRKRSYVYFLSFAKSQKKWHGAPPPQRRRGRCLNCNSNKSAKILCPRPAWDDTINDLSVWKLSPAELVRFTLHNQKQRKGLINPGALISLPPGQV
ncbi:unnamed protein product [Calypogeia fissa]